MLTNGSLDGVDDEAQLPQEWTTKHPANVRSVEAAGRKGTCIEMTGNEGLMGGYGTDLFSAPIAIKPNVRYRVSGVAKSAGPKQILFVKGFASVTRRIDGVEKTADEIVYQMKKEIDPTKDWKSFSMEFDIRPAKVFSDFQHEVKYVRVLLWAYWPAGTCWYDDLVFEELGPVADAGKRHDRAMTHTGEAPRLNDDKDATPPAPGSPPTPPESPAAPAAGSYPAAFPPEANPAAPALDIEQTWIDASNAWRENHYDTAADLAQKILAGQPDHVNARLLAARSLLKIDKTDEAAVQLDWLDKAWGKRNDADAVKVETWQREFALLARGEWLLKSGRSDEAKAMLLKLKESTTSEHIRHGVEAVLETPAGK